MKLLTVIILLLSFSFLSAQEIQVNEIDKFTKQKRIETDHTVINGSVFCYLELKLRSVDTTCFIELRGSGCAVGAVGEQDYLMFLLDNDSTVKVYSKGIQSYHIGQNVKSYAHEYAINRHQLMELQTNKVKSVRRTFDNSYYDLDVKPKFQERIQKLNEVFLSALAK
jgi:hypothetical protein